MNRLENVQYVVCHGDMNHNNWMHDEQENLYLIDWDGATVADPALDLGLLLYSYIPEERWADWLSYYGVALTTSLRVRMHWYVVAYTISEMLWNQNRKKYEQVQEYRERLSYLLNSSSCPR